MRIKRLTSKTAGKAVIILDRFVKAQPFTATFTSLRQESATHTRGCGHLKLNIWLKRQRGHEPTHSDTLSSLMVGKVALDTTGNKMDYIIKINQSWLSPTTGGQPETLWY